MPEWSSGRCPYMSPEQVEGGRLTPAPTSSVSDRCCTKCSPVRERSPAMRIGRRRHRSSSADPKPVNELAAIGAGGARGRRLALPPERSGTAVPIHRRRQGRARGRAGGTAFRIAGKNDPAINRDGNGHRCWCCCRRRSPPGTSRGPNGLNLKAHPALGTADDASRAGSLADARAGRRTSGVHVVWSQSG